MFNTFTDLSPAELDLQIESLRALTPTNNVQAIYRSQMLARCLYLRDGE